MVWARGVLGVSLQNAVSARISLPPQSKERAPQAQTVMGYRVAVVGATGNVGPEMLQILAERDFPADDVVALASARSARNHISFDAKPPLTIPTPPKFTLNATAIMP